MTETTTNTAAASVETMMKQFLESLEPTVMSMAKAAVGSFLPAVAAAPVDAVLDTVDTLVQAHNPSIASAAAAAGAAPVATGDTLADLTARVSALEAHVAALTIATGLSTSQNLATVKASVVASQAAAAASSLAAPSVQ